MKLSFLFLCVAILFCNCLHAQAPKETQIKTTDEMRDELTAKGIYRFRNFQNGTVVFKNGTTSTAPLNYNIWLEEMHFINEKGDTLAISDPGLISYIDIDQNRFFYEKGFMEAIDKNNKVVLAVKQVLKTETQRKGAFGLPTLSNSAKAYDMYAADGQSYQLGQNQDLLIISKVYYFFGDEYNHFSAANKDYILGKYPRMQNAIEDFVATNNIKFNRLADLQKLLKFCSDLQ